MRFLNPCLIALSAFVLCVPAARAQGTASAGAESWGAELKRAEDEIRTVRTEFGNQYRRKLAELRAGFQQAGDLENALLARDLEKNSETAPVPLQGMDVVAAPRSVRELQLELIGKQRDLLGAIVQKVMPKLVESKRSLTKAGRLDEASEVLAAILRLYEGAAVPVEKIANGGAVLAEELYLAYQAARQRADHIYKGRQIALRGRVLGIRPDPRDSSAMVLVIYPEVEGGFIDCSFGTNMRLQEERQGQATVYALRRGPADPAPFRFQKGASVEVLGKCEGWDEGVRLQDCSGCNLWKR